MNYSTLSGENIQIIPEFQFLRSRADLEDDPDKNANFHLKLKCDFNERTKHFSLMTSFWSRSPISVLLDTLPNVEIGNG